jgi:primosomal protein N' (replication factor Y)
MPVNLSILDYLIPKELEANITPGQLVSIPFRNSLEFAIVHSIEKSTGISRAKLKAIDSITTPRPFIGAEQLAFLDEMAAFYSAPLGFLVKGNVLPLKKRKIKRIGPDFALAQNRGSSISSKGNREKNKKISKPRFVLYKNFDDKRSSLAKNIPKKGQCLILVPELHDIEFLIALLSPTQRSRTIIITSETSEKDLFDLWLKIWQEPNTIVIGTRTALFLPWWNLQSIILDDEGSFAHKSWDMAPRYHTRDAALLLSQHHKAQLTLLTHTPSVESYYFAKHGVYETSVGTGRDLSLQGDWTIINTSDERKGGNYNLLSDEVAEAVQKNTLGVTFLYLNRRGNVHYVACRDCGLVSRCGACQTTLTYFETKGELKCLKCNYTETFQATCKKCGGMSLRTFGAGTQELFKEVKKLVGKDRNVVRLDKDDNKDLPNLALPGSITIGTQYAWSRIQWQHINVMTFVDADTPIFVPEFRSGEELWQELHSAKCNIAENGKIFVQTSHPEHAVFTSLTNPETFYTSELESRKQFNYPPYSYLVKLWCSGTNERDTEENAEMLHRRLARLTQGDKNITIASPIPAFPAYFKGQYRYIILAKISYRFYKKYTKLLVSQLPSGWKVDPNPNTVLSL